MQTNIVLNKPNVEGKNEIKMESALFYKWKYKKVTESF